MRTILVVDVRNSQTGETRKVLFKSQAETLKHPIGSTYSR